MALRTKAAKLFSVFPAEVYLTYERDGDSGYYMLWEDKKDATENSLTNNSEVAVYSLQLHGKASVTYDVTIEDNR